MTTELGRKRLWRIHTIEQLEAKFEATDDADEAERLEILIALHEEASDLELTIDDLDRIIFEMRVDSGLMTEEEIQWWKDKDQKEEDEWKNL